MYSDNCYVFAVHMLREAGTFLQLIESTFLQHVEWAYAMFSGHVPAMHSMYSG